MVKATVTLNGGTLNTEWNGIAVGKRFRITRDDKNPNYRERYWFVASKIEPTYEGSDYAWVTGVRVNGRGAILAKQIFHRHLMGSERQELIHVNMIG